MKKRENKRGMGKLFIIGIMVFALILGIMLISALTPEEQNALENELNSLERNLNENGYGWLINYSILFGRLNKSIYIHNIMYLYTYS